MPVEDVADPRQRLIDASCKASIVDGAIGEWRKKKLQACMDEQEAQLWQRGRAMPRVVEYFG